MCLSDVCCGVASQLRRGTLLLIRCACFLCDMMLCGCSVRAAMYVVVVALPICVARCCVVVCLHVFVCDVVGWRRYVCVVVLCVALRCFD